MAYQPNKQGHLGITTWPLPSLVPASFVWGLPLGRCWLPSRPCLRSSIGAASNSSPAGSVVQSPMQAVELFVDEGDWFRLANGLMPWADTALQHLH